MRILIRGRDGSSGYSENSLTVRSVVRIRPLPLDFPCLGLGNLALSQPSCFLLVAWQLGTKTVLQLNSYLFGYEGTCLTHNWWRTTHPSLQNSHRTGGRTAYYSTTSQEGSMLSHCVGLIIIDSMKSVFNTDALLPYNHDLVESLIVKQRIKVDGGETWCQLTTIIPKCLHLQTFTQAIRIETDNKNITDIGWQPYLAVSPTRR
ncbi:hypothetical protein CSKR_107977, partial [Clonorchis sinensis]